MQKLPSAKRFEKMTLGELDRFVEDRYGECVEMGLFVGADAHVVLSYPKNVYAKIQIRSAGSMGAALRRLCELGDVAFSVTKSFIDRPEY